MHEAFRSHFSQLQKCGVGSTVFVPIAFASFLAMPVTFKCWCPVEFSTCKKTTSQLGEFDTFEEAKQKVMHHLIHSDKHYLEVVGAEDLVHISPNCIAEEEIVVPSSPPLAWPQGPPPPNMEPPLRRPSSSSLLRSRTDAHRLMPYARMPASPPRAVGRPKAKARGEVVSAIGAPPASSSPSASALQEVVNALRRCEEAATHASRLSAMAAVQFRAEALVIKEARLVVEDYFMQLDL